MERVVQQYLSSKGTDLDLKQQFVLYEVSGAPWGDVHVPSPGEGGCAGWEQCPGGSPGVPVPSAERSQAGGRGGGAITGWAQGEEEDR